MSFKDPRSKWWRQTYAGLSGQVVGHGLSWVVNGSLADVMTARQMVPFLSALAGEFASTGLVYGVDEKFGGSHYGNVASLVNGVAQVALASPRNNLAEPFRNLPPDSQWVSNPIGSAQQTAMAVALSPMNTLTSSQQLVNLATRNPTVAGGVGSVVAKILANLQDEYNDPAGLRFSNLFAVPFLGFVAQSIHNANNPGSKRDDLTSGLATFGVQAVGDVIATMAGKDQETVLAVFAVLGGINILALASD